MEQKQGFYADLHLHTHYSDGTRTLDQLFTLLKEYGVQVAAVTDHDTVFHYDAVKETAARYGIKTIRGVELSCYDYDVDKLVHVLGLYLNEDPYHVKALGDGVLAHREIYHTKLIGVLQKKGYRLTYEDCKATAPYNVLFKKNLFLAIKRNHPELAGTLTFPGVFGETTKEENMQMGYIPVEQAIQAILQDGGVPVLAHPCEYDNYDEIPKYVGFGLQGIEISHSRMKPEDYPRVQYYVDKYGLLGSGGSDYHEPERPTMGKAGLTQEQFDRLEAGVEKLQQKNHTENGSED